jgi:hypothetical protein
VPSGQGHQYHLLLLLLSGGLVRGCCQRRPHQHLLHLTLPLQPGLLPPQGGWERQLPALAPQLLRMHPLLPGVMLLAVLLLVRCWVGSQ